jgi:hypothetical protein
VDAALAGRRRVRAGHKEAEQVEARGRECGDNRKAHQPAVEKTQRGQLEHVEADVAAKLRVRYTEGLAVEKREHSTPTVCRDRPEDER